MCRDWRPLLSHGIANGGSAPTHSGSASAKRGKTLVVGGTRCSVPAAVRTAVGPGLTNLADGLVLGLVQEALFGGRKRRVGQHALIMQLAQAVQLN